ncbi:MAG: acyltransferase family protein [Bacteroidia bacterium]|nr:acyltransferase family protein [Bacteroidia bacterium]
MINAFRNYSLLLVVFIHSHIYMVEYAKIDVPKFLLGIYNSFLGYFHPASILAAISGYLFFRDFSNNPQHWNTFIKEKYAKRIKSILVPFVFWVGFFFVFNNLLIFIVNGYKSNVFVNAPQTISPLNFIKSLFYPELAVAKHLWYLNNLLFVFILAPLFPYVTKNKPLFFTLLLAIMTFYWWEFESNVTQTQLIIKYRFIIFFLVGAFFGLNKQYFNFFLTKKLLLSSISMAILASLLVMNVSSQRDYATLYVINSLIVPVLVFYFAFLILQKFSNVNETLYNRANHFLLYVIHPMIISVLCKMLYYSGLLNFNNYYLALLIVFAMSWAVVKLNTLIYQFISRYFKSFAKNFL